MKHKLCEILKDNKKWWLVPLIIYVILLIGLTIYQQKIEFQERDYESYPTCFTFKEAKLRCENVNGYLLYKEHYWLCVESAKNQLNPISKFLAC